MTYEAHEKYTTWLFRAYTKPARAGYHPVSLSQIHATDQEVFVKLAMATENGLNKLSDHSLVLDKLVKEVMTDVDVSSLLVPFQKSAGGYYTDERNQGTKRPFESTKEPSYGGGKKGSDKGKGKPKGKGKGKGDKGKGKPTGAGNMPLDLFNMGNMVSEHKGRRICYAYNLQGCDNHVKATNDCSKGLHVCCRNGCGGNHPQSYEKCPKR
jgi:hypothetical protein